SDFGPAAGRLRHLRAAPRRIPVPRLWPAFGLGLHRGATPHGLAKLGDAGAGRRLFLGESVAAAVGGAHDLCGGAAGAAAGRRAVGAGAGGLHDILFWGGGAGGAATYRAAHAGAAAHLGGGGAGAAGGGPHPAVAGGARLALPAPHGAAAR
nr:hypothetical protein [Tanacetum cinerariifolium]